MRTARIVNELSESIVFVLESYGHEIHGKEMCTT